MAGNFRSTFPPLPPGWTEHSAPTGHTYFHNTETKESTYRRPTNSNFTTPAYTESQQRSQRPYIQLSDPRVANAFMSRNSKVTTRGEGGSFPPAAGRSRPEHKTPHQPTDKPVSKVAIPGHEPWILVLTKLGRRFVFNPTKNTSYWRIPDKLKSAILDLDRARILKMAEENTEPSDLIAGECHHTGHKGRLAVNANVDLGGSCGLAGESLMQVQHVASLGDSDSEYEEIEVADDWDGDEVGIYQNPLKRQRMEDFGGLTEFGEDDIAFQLQAAAEGLDESGRDGLWGAAGDSTELNNEDAPTVFKALLADFGINPYSSWEKIIEEGKLIDDPRYTVLETMKARKTVWEDWSRTRIRELKEEKAKEEKADPLLSYLAFLQRCATPRLFWPEFKRKYRKEAEIRDLSLSDKEKEKWYRDYVNRLKLPPATLKSDFTQLLKSIPVLGVEENSLPRQIATDIRYICLDSKVREPLIKAYFQTIQEKAS